MQTAITELGYRRNRAARWLVTNRSGRFGMITAHLGLYGPRMIALGVEQAGQAAGYEVSVVGLPDSSVESPSVDLVAPFLRERSSTAPR